MPDALRPTANEAHAAWAARVRANREQVDRFREAPERQDFYAPVASGFKADPRRTGDAALDALLSLVQPGETWLDIGAGGGRFALPLALRAEEVIAVDPSDGMLAILQEAMDEYDVPNVRIIQSRWPMTVEAPVADCALIANVGNDIEDIGAFLDAMERSARRLCVAINPARPPAAYAEPFWPTVHGEARIQLPALPELVTLLIARGTIPEVRLIERPPMSYEQIDDTLRFLRQQLWVEPGGAKDRKLQDLVPSLVTERAGRWAVNWETMPVGIVSWRPSGR